MGNPRGGREGAGSFYARRRPSSRRGGGSRATPPLHAPPPPGPEKPPTPGRAPLPPRLLGRLRPAPPPRPRRPGRPLRPAPGAGTLVAQRDPDALGAGPHPAAAARVGRRVRRLPRQRHVPAPGLPPPHQG